MNDEYWKCPHCGSDKSWFDRSFIEWLDDDGKHHMEGPWVRCKDCGKADDEPVSTTVER